MDEETGIPLVTGRCVLRLRGGGVAQSSVPQDDLRVLQVTRMGQLLHGLHGPTDRGVRVSGFPGVPGTVILDDSSEHGAGHCSKEGL